VDVTVNVDVPVDFAVCVIFGEELELGVAVVVRVAETEDVAVLDGIAVLELETERVAVLDAEGVPEDVLVADTDFDSVGVRVDVAVEVELIVACDETDDDLVALLDLVPLGVLVLDTDAVGVREFVIEAEDVLVAEEDRVEVLVADEV